MILQEALLNEGQAILRPYFISESADFGTPFSPSFSRSASAGIRIGNFPSGDLDGYTKPKHEARKAVNSPESKLGSPIYGAYRQR
jgi:hypothetical protein